eukprot:4136914-Prymnesium_polylepis.2
MEKLNSAGGVTRGGAGGAQPTGGAPAHAEVRGWLQHAGFSSQSAEKCASAMAAVGLDSVQAVRAASPAAEELEGYGATAAEAGLALAALEGQRLAGLSALLAGAGLGEERAASAAAALAADGYDSYVALGASGFDAAGLQAPTARRHASTPALT